MTRPAPVLVEASLDRIDMEMLVLMVRAIRRRLRASPAKKFADERRSFSEVEIALENFKPAYDEIVKNCAAIMQSLNVPVTGKYPKAV